ncbi:MAG: hypothetical protein KAV41_00775 [Candidatus Pacebacteria bacterium]|nr:hypothetical protein [Candidatus Paceibacterota bacterium]
METKKIATACFIGGFICAAVAVAVNPMFWWLGLIAGSAGGYLAYEFREVLQAIPRAWKLAKEGSGAVWEIVKHLFKECFTKSHPVWHSAVVCFVLIFLFFYRLFPKSDLTSCFAVTMMLDVVFFLIIVSLLVEIGTKQRYKTDLLLERYQVEAGETWQPITYRDFFRWVTKGIFGITLFFFWTMWKWIAIGIYRAICFSGRFLKNLFILIHSNKRLLCAIDGAIGGAVAYIWLISPSVTIWEKIGLCVCGGLLGAVIGVANYEVVSKRVLRLST